MTEQEEIEEYQNTLNNALSILCEAMGVDPERYDTDQADFACYMDCFHEAAVLIKRMDCIFDDNEGEFICRGIK